MVQISYLHIFQEHYLTPNEAYYKCANNKCYNAKDILLEVA